MTIAASGAGRGLTLDPYLIETLLPDLVGHDGRPAAFVVYLCLWCATHGAGRERVFLSYAALQDRTGLSKSAVQRSVALLLRRQLLAQRKGSATAVPEYRVLTPWRRKSAAAPPAKQP